MRRLFAAVTTAVMATTCLITAFAAPASAQGRTLKVPSQYRTISSAIAAARNLDTIVVSAGLYREAVVINHKYVFLKAATKNRPVIWAPAGKSPVTFTNVPVIGRNRLRPSIEGFSIQKGVGPRGKSGGITVYNNASPTIRNNVIERGSSAIGAGIVVWGNSSPKIIGNTIRNNTAREFGGGIWVGFHSNPEITDNTIVGNQVFGYKTASGGSSGGGLFLMNDPNRPGTRSSPIVKSNVIRNNHASFSGGAFFLGTGVNGIFWGNTITGNTAPYGGGFELETHGGAPQISKNVIKSNASAATRVHSGSGNGGGIAVYGMSRPIVSSNTIVGNAATHGGAGVVVAEGSMATIECNTIGSNRVTGGGGADAGGGVHIANATVTVRNNAIYGNTAARAGGVAVLGSGKVVLTNNTIARNTGRHSSKTTPANGGLYIGTKAPDSVRVINNAIAMNNGQQVFEYGTAARYGNNLIANDGSGMFFSYPAKFIKSAANFHNNRKIRAATGNISLAPDFVNVGAGNLRPAKGSALVDHGSAGGAPAKDLADRHRPRGRAIDIGAYEY